VSKQTIEDIKGRIFGKKQSSDDSLVETICIIMDEIGLGYKELFGEEINSEHQIFIKGKEIGKIKTITKRNGLPIPFFHSLVKYLDKKAKETEKARRRANNKK